MIYITFTKFIIHYSFLKWLFCIDLLILLMLVGEEGVGEEEEEVEEEEDHHLKEYQTENIH